ncbi:hypothetical protein A4X09_0g2635 [Tilletia walkeri]|uniref:Ndc10 domain-containing protein n=1 Tax=Tilletia walkeri TaxID=117179 RepID=A0A8X7T6B9_9BASI|nr:hypothetical protein A4X09_0g2635 [Tilletia walkeri]
MNEPSIEGSAAASPAQASASAEPASNTAVKVGGRTTKVRTDGVAYTPEKKMIAVFLAFSGSGKGKKGGKRKREDAEEKLGCKSTALYRWKKAYPEAAAARDEAIDAVGAIGKILATIRSRSDEANLAAFLVPEFSVPMPSSNPAGPTSGGGQLVVRPDGLGPTSELGPGSMPPELLACLRLVDDDSGGELTDEERDRLSIAVDADVPEAGEELVYHSMTLGAKLAYSNLAKGTAGLWKGPQQKYIAFWRSLFRLRAENEVDKEAASKLEVLATEQKLITWLNCSVLFRNPTLGYESIRTCVKAINNLWEQQHLAGRNDHQQPGSGKLCSQFIRAVKLNQAELARLTNIDKFRNTLRDGYDETGFADVSRWFLAHSSVSEFLAVRDRFSFLWQHAIMGRSEDLRERELSDFYCAELKSKSNRDARPERGVAARHRDVEVCSVGAFAMYLFFRFHVFSEPVPDFSSRDSWYRIKLLIDHETHGSKFKGSKKGPVSPTFSISCKDGLRSKSAEFYSALAE